MSPKTNDTVMPDRGLARLVVQEPDYRFKWYFDTGLVGLGYHFVFRQRLVRILSILKKHGILPRRILDIGCGPMVPSHAILSRFSCDYFGLDLQEQGVFKDFTRLLHSSTGKYECIYPLRASGDRVPFRDSVFDTVLALDVLEHVDVPVAILAEIERVATRNAALVVSLPLENTFTKLAYLAHILRGERVKFGRLEYHYGGNIPDYTAMMNILGKKWQIAETKYSPLGLSPIANINAIHLFHKR